MLKNYERKDKIIEVIDLTNDDKYSSVSYLMKQIPSLRNNDFLISNLETS